MNGRFHPHQAGCVTVSRAATKVGHNGVIQHTTHSTDFYGFSIALATCAFLIVVICATVLCAKHADEAAFTKIFAPRVPDEPIFFVVEFAVSPIAKERHGMVDDRILLAAMEDAAAVAEPALVGSHR